MGLFSQKPFHKVTMDDIARGANVAKGTLYYHFTSKDKLYECILLDGLEAVLQTLGTTLDQGDAQENLKIFIEKLFLFIHEKRDFFTVLQREELKNGSGIKENCRIKICDLKKLLVDVLREGAAAGRFRRNLDYALVAEMILGMLKAVTVYNSGKRSALFISDIILNGISDRESYTGNQSDVRI